MGHSKIAAGLAILALALVGCASARWAVLKQLREPGESLVDFPEIVWEQYDCDIQRRPFFAVEENELFPPSVRPGSDFGHRLVYVMCPPEPTGVVTGLLHTRIRYRGAPIVRHADSSFEIKPGRWVVDTVVELPAEAEPGVYAYELEFESADIRFEKNLTFVVQTP